MAICCRKIMEIYCLDSVTVTVDLSYLEMHCQRIHHVSIYLQKLT